MDTTAIFSFVLIIILLICLLSIVNMEHTKACLRKMPCFAEMACLQPSAQEGELQLPTTRKRAARLEEMAGDPTRISRPRHTTYTKRMASSFCRYRKVTDRPRTASE